MCLLQEGTERQVDIFGEDIVESAVVVVFDPVLVIRPREVSADFPDERFELVLEPVSSHVPEDQDLLGVSLEVRPQIVMIRDDDITVEVFCHSQDITGSHLVGDTSRVLTEGTEGDVDLVFVSVFCVHVSEVAVTAVVDSSCRSFDDVGNSSFIHVVTRKAFDGSLWRR